MRLQPGCNMSIPLDVINAKHDVNKDGKLSWDELKKAFSGLGVTWVRWTTDRALLKADDDEDGCISEKEMDKLIEFVIKRKLSLV
ncbi:putative calcium-binding protein CML10 [Tanacetum coccineum]